MAAKKKNWWRIGLAGAAALASVGLAVWLGTDVFGGGSPGPSELTLHPERQEEIAASRRAGALAARLELDAEQTAELARVVMHFREERRKLRREHAGDMAGLMRAGRAKMAEFDAAVRALLTPEQEARYDDMAAQQRKRLGFARQLGFGPPTGDAQ